MKVEAPITASRAMASLGSTMDTNTSVMAMWLKVLLEMNGQKLRHTRPTALPLRTLMSMMSTLVPKSVSCSRCWQLMVWTWTIEEPMDYAADVIQADMETERSTRTSRASKVARTRARARSILMDSCL